MPSRRKNCWKTKPIVPGPEGRQGPVGQLADLLAGHQDGPAVGRSRVPMTCSRVDLPDPLGPAMASSSPSSTVRLTPAQDSSSGGPA
jgi:hypothetical protein